MQRKSVAGPAVKHFGVLLSDISVMFSHELHSFTRTKKSLLSGDSRCSLMAASPRIDHLLFIFRWGLLS